MIKINRKNTLLVFLFLASSLLLSCSKQEDAVSAQQKPLPEVVSNEVKLLIDRPQVSSEIKKDINELASELESESESESESEGKLNQVLEPTYVTSQVADTPIFVTENKQLEAVRPKAKVVTRPVK